MPPRSLLELETGVVSPHAADAPFARFNRRLNERIRRHVGNAQSHITNPLRNLLNKIVHNLERSKREKRVHVVRKGRKVVVAHVEMVELAEHFAILWESYFDNLVPIHVQVLQLRNTDKHFLIREVHELVVAKVEPLEVGQVPLLGQDV